MAVSPMYDEPMEQSSPGCRLAAVATIIGVVVLLAAMLFPAIESAREASRRAGCIGNGKGIGLAMQGYASANATLPPAYQERSTGTRHSWRILIEQHWDTPLWEHYDTRQPWNSGDNMAVAKTEQGGMGGKGIYACPSDTQRKPMETDFVMAVGKETISDGPTGVSYKAITHGVSRTIVAAETTESGILWTEPRDYDFGKMSFRVNDRAGPAVRSPHPGVANVVFGDASVNSVSETIDPSVLKGRFTIAGGEPFDSEP
jgi:hypothetical protein